MNTSGCGCEREDLTECQRVKSFAASFAEASTWGIWRTRGDDDTFRCRNSGCFMYLQVCQDAFLV